MPPLDSSTTYDAKLSSILRSAADVFARKGYHDATIRDVSAAAGVSLSGLYYYVESKEHLLFLIQDERLGCLLRAQHQGIMDADGPEERVRSLVRTHLRAFAENAEEMKVLSRESDALTGRYWDVIDARRREYVDLARSVLSEVRPTPSPVDLRSATFFLFGMMNWLHNWYDAEQDGNVEHLADQMAHVVLRGLSDPNGWEPGPGVMGPE